ncbi:MAG TPA: ribonuclease III [Candidatus Saccharimonadia bacterium]|nr:ribonuclease III [Candidatus Saccharimonadia bacterium]
MTDGIAGLGYRFGNDALLAEALTHRSAGRPNNERLEFLGDSILSSAVSEALFVRFAGAHEGEMTRWRAELVREQTLAAIARELGLGDRLNLGQGELKSGGFRRDSILADALEAIIGAVYVDAGWDGARSLVLSLFATRLDAIAAEKPQKDAKTRLQELLQGNGHGLPRYELVDTRGDDHDKVFVARCSIDVLGIAADGEGTTRRGAETAAAEAALADIDARESNRADA